MKQLNYRTSQKVTCEPKRDANGNIVKLYFLVIEVIQQNVDSNFFCEGASNNFLKHLMRKNKVEWSYNIIIQKKKMY
jgi:hypothetical protein